MSPEPAGPRKVLLFEMNEVPWRILDDYAARRPGGALARLLARSRQFDTVCEDQVELDPWIGWPTLHRGVIDEQHGVRHLGQSLEGADARHPPVWELLARAGRTVGVFGSLHSGRRPERLDRYAFLVPDFFAADGFVHPPELAAFQRFNLAMTRRSARNVDGAIPLGAAAAFARRYLREGLHWPSVGRVAAALCAERLRRHLKTRRRSLQPLLGLDVFLPLVRRTRPQFATFYTNHVAANMHRFWAAAYPDDAGANPMPQEWRRKYRGEIRYAMDVLDVLAGRLRALADERDYLLVAASAIGQAGVPGESTRGFVTITDLGRFMARLGLAAGEWRARPAMVPCISVAVDPARAGAFEAGLRALSIGPHRVQASGREGAAAFSYDRSGEDAFHFFVYFNETDLAALPARLGGRSFGAAELGLGYFRHEEEVACSGRHTPFGALFVYDPRRAAPARERATVSTLELAPALLRNFGAPVPAYMAAGERSLLDVAAPAPARAAFRGGGVEQPVTRPPSPSIHHAWEANA